MNMNDFSIVIFGATGDLAQGKLFPALTHLWNDEKFRPKHIIAVGRREYNSETFRPYIADSQQTRGIEVPPELLDRVSYIRGTFDEETVYASLHAFLKENPAEVTLFYLAISPQFFAPVIEGMNNANITTDCRQSGRSLRIAVEKPFGVDLKSAQELDQKLCSSFSEEEIYRIDHYLGKLSSQNLMALRFYNRVFRDNWNGNDITDVVLRFHEASDVASRGSFYDQVGAFLDVGQSHMLQQFAVLTMPQPAAITAESIRNARAEVLESLVLNEECAITRAQYAGYRETEGVHDDSETETYFHICALSSHPNWKNTSFTFEAGKALPYHCVEIEIHFAPVNVGGQQPHNELFVRFSPDERMQFTFYAENPSVQNDYTTHWFEVSYADAGRVADAYEKILYDLSEGDQTLFASQREIEASWRFAKSAQDVLKSVPLSEYEKGTLPAHARRI